MGKLIYSMLVSVDGHINRPQGGFAWAEPDDETLEYITERMQAVGTYLYGRLYYETMTNWANLRTVPGLKPLDYRFSDLWNATTKWVFTRTLGAPATDNTRLVREFDADALRELKATSDQHITVEGAQIARLCLEAGLVDELSIYQVPLSTGGGTPFLPRDVPLGLALVDERRFDSGIVNLRYDVWY